MLCRFHSCLLQSYVLVILSPALEMKSWGLGEVRSSREGIYSSKAHVHNRFCSQILGTVSLTHQKGCFSPELTRKHVHTQPITTVQLSCITFFRMCFLLWTILLENVVHGSTGTTSDLSLPRKLPGTPQWLRKYLWKGRITDQVNKGWGKIAQPRSSLVVETFILPCQLIKMRLELSFHQSVQKDYPESLCQGECSGWNLHSEEG